MFDFIVAEGRSIWPNTTVAVLLTAMLSLLSYQVGLGYGTPYIAAKDYLCRC